MDELGFFFKKPAQSLFILYQCLTSCKELEKSSEQFSGKSDYLPTKPTRNSMTSRGFSPFATPQDFFSKIRCRGKLGLQDIRTSKSWFPGILWLHESWYPGKFWVEREIRTPNKKCSNARKKFQVIWKGKRILTLIYECIKSKGTLCNFLGQRLISRNWYHWG